MKIFSIKNEKLNFFNRPIYCESSAEALSYIQNILMSDSDRALTGLKDDLSLYELGEIDFSTGYISSNSIEITKDLKRHRAGDIIDNGSVNLFPEKVCSLREIFDSIPTDRLQTSVTRDELNSLRDIVSGLALKYKELCDNNEIHEKITQEGEKR